MNSRKVRGFVLVVLAALLLPATANADPVSVLALAAQALIINGATYAGLAVLAVTGAYGVIVERRKRQDGACGAGEEP